MCRISKFVANPGAFQSYVANCPGPNFLESELPSPPALPSFLAITDATRSLTEASRHAALNLPFFELKEGLTAAGRYIHPLDVNLGPEYNLLKSLVDGGGYGEDIREVQPASVERDTLNEILRNIATENGFANVKAYMLLYKEDSTKDFLDSDRALLGYHGDSIPIDPGAPGAVRLQLPIFGLASFRFKSRQINSQKTAYLTIKNSPVVEYTSVPGHINTMNRFQCGQVATNPAGDIFTHHGIFNASPQQRLDNPEFSTNCRASLIVTFYGKTTHLNAPVVISEAAVGPYNNATVQVSNPSLADFDYIDLTDSALCHFCDGNSSSIHYTPTSLICGSIGEKRKMDDSYQPNTCVDCFNEVNLKLRKKPYYESFFLIINKLFLIN